mmetsp:Transcript_56810/g.120616  ORF Transcript_56810/g.120616 Transcript_56810/m.120616 type:complete len:219 (+) Transcript_56810:268-924(+)
MPPSGASLVAPRYFLVPILHRPLHQGDALVVAPPPRQVQRRLPEGIPQRRVDPPVLQERPHALRALRLVHAPPQEARAHQRRAAALAPRVGIRAGLQEQGYQVRVAAHRRPAEGRVAEPPRRLGGAPGVEEQPRHRLVPRDARLDERRHAVRVLGVLFDGQEKPGRLQVAGPGGAVEGEFALLLGECLRIGHVVDDTGGCGAGGWRVSERRGEINYYR